MLANTLVITAEDGTKMQSLQYKSEGQTHTIVVHVHGMAGNFYENSFIEEIATKCNKSNMDFLAFNNRGHDYIADCEREKDGEIDFYSAGGAYEKFEECIYDIKGVIQWAISEGYNEIFLEGHSSGCNKIVYSFEKINNDLALNGIIKGLILISPCDDIGVFHSEIDEEKRKASFDLAQKYIDAGNGAELMPQGTFFDYLLSAKTFLNCFTEGSSLDMFPYRNGNLEKTALGKISIPKLVLFGNNGDFVLQEMDEIRKMFDIGNVQNYEMEVIDQAGHSYRGHEEKLAITIIEWLERQKR